MQIVVIVCNDSRKRHWKITWRYSSPAQITNVFHQILWRTITIRWYSRLSYWVIHIWSSWFPYRCWYIKSPGNVRGKCILHLHDAVHNTLSVSIYRIWWLKKHVVPYIIDGSLCRSKCIDFQFICWMGYKLLSIMDFVLMFSRNLIIHPTAHF